MLKHTIFLLAVVFLMTCSVATAAENDAGKVPEKGAAKAAEKPVATPVQKSIEKQAAKPAELPALKPAEIPAAKPAVEPDEAPVDITTIDNKKITIPAKQFHRLTKVKSAGVTFLYPTSMPARFKLKYIRVPDKDPKHVEYRAVFNAKKRSSFTIETAYSGINKGPAGSRIISGHSNQFGPFKINVFKPHTKENKSKIVHYRSDWLKLKRKQSKDAARFYHFFGTGVTDAEALAIVKSLTPIR